RLEIRIDLHAVVAAGLVTLGHGHVAHDVVGEVVAQHHARADVAQAVADLHVLSHGIGEYQVLPEHGRVDAGGREQAHLVERVDGPVQRGGFARHVVPGEMLHVAAQPDAGGQVQAVGQVPDHVAVQGHRGVALVVEDFFAPGLADHGEG